jgi:hypothetical protein
MFAGKRQAQVPRTDAGVLAGTPWVCAARAGRPGGALGPR